MEEFNNGFKINQDAVEESSEPQQNVPTPEPPVQNTAPQAPNSQPYGNNNGSGGYNRYYLSPENRPGHSTTTVIIAAVVAAIIGAVSALGVFSLSGGFQKGKSDNSNTSNVTIDVKEESTSIAEAVAKKATDSVVGIRTTTSVMNFFGGSQEATGEGSGVIYSKDGYIITNYHVIENAVEAGSSKIDVFLNSDSEKAYHASVVGYHISSDLAVLKIEAENLHPAELGDSSKLTVGQYVVTIGAPGGLEFMGSVTYGVISGLDRVVSTTNSVSLIQTDAAINPGNSGGALLDSSGKLIGINSSKIVSEEFEGMGFAIPVNTVKEKCDKIINRKDEPEAYIGVSISERYTADVLEFYGYPAGAVVLSVDGGSPADEAGIQRGDIITEFNGTAITDYKILYELINDCSPGDTVTAKVYRNGGIGTATIKVASAGAKQ